ncbi:MAG: hypothetical protein COV29_04195 [Candidatus Yanofskybacteria bacterium CG10_big_fil_rev_8_21_14_0_10_36_16]|uniref:Conjugal transfer protein TrbC n=1 Tax=Candidatus Yanofskybacteria bacterium CG10_big_fil_rev_8_21_14_0_10_36_16 TaxID=1975096 RepID=A0A2J0Q9Z1_9BACT|nr:MAG: hypothetical protein COV29_04195 [Candidatus Yanofskybacteria bacterium CG10_big_fil_rev_8_21_14_0_10_36_16]
MGTVGQSFVLIPELYLKMKIFNKKNISKVAVLLFLAGFALSANAQFTNPEGALEIPGNPVPDSEELNLTSILDAITTIAQFLLFAGALIAVIFIVWGGILWMSAGGDSSKVARARQTIINGLIGSIIVLGIGTIMSTAGYLFNAIAGGSL